MNETARQKAQALQIQDWGNAARTGTEGLAASAGRAQLCKVYYFHTDQVGMPQELTNAQGQVPDWATTCLSWAVGATSGETKVLTDETGNKFERGRRSSCQCATPRFFYEFYLSQFCGAFVG
ncbi:RHS domain-containing protein [Comamonas sp. 4034]|uniref:RHS domain-containing protein n=1 Tax=Comamonas sp. 4034 TaxID=3156455 RepID=UPI003D1ED9E8